MVIIKRISMPLYERAALDNALAQAAKNAADLEYISMMAEIDLEPEEEEAEDFGEEEGLNE